MPVAFIVDGYTEKKILQRICCGAPIRMTDLNGRNVSVGAIAKSTGTHIRLFKGRYFPVFVIVDREGKELSATQMEQALREELCNQPKVNIDEVIIVCPDRMIENWMLGDHLYFRNEFNIEITKSCEGKDGKAIIRRLLKEKNINYHETTVGVDIFCRINPHLVCETNASFARLWREAQHFCPWLRRR